MTPADRIRDVLAAHGVSPDTVSLTEPRTTLGEELERESSKRAALAAIETSKAMRESVHVWRKAVEDLLREWERSEAKHRRHLARLRWRHEHAEDGTPFDHDRLFYRDPVDGIWPTSQRLCVANWGLRREKKPVCGPRPAAWDRYLAAEAKAGAR